MSSSFLPTVSTAEILAAAVNGLHYNFSGILERFGRDLFLVDGDALLAHVLEESASPASFQLLPLVYRVEHALTRLKRLGAQFRVFFLASHARLGWRGERSCGRAFHGHTLTLHFLPLPLRPRCPHAHVAPAAPWPLCPISCLCEHGEARGVRPTAACGCLVHVPVTRPPCVSCVLAPVRGRA